jgi:5'-methylthioadenosine phosphorylase
MPASPKTASPKKVPPAKIGIIGGSATFSLDFPGVLEGPKCRVLKTGLVFETPFGTSPPFKLLEVQTKSGPERALACRMHGWRRPVKRAQASLQVFWVFSEAGAAKVLADGGVGSLNHLLDPRDVVICDDYIDMTVRKDIYVRGDHLLIMRRPVCPVIHSALLTAATTRFGGGRSDGSSDGSRGGRVFERGIYLVTEGPNFESPAEVAMMRHAGGDVIGQSFCPEVILARDIGACYAGLYMVVNHGEGVVKDWEHKELAAIFADEAEGMGAALLDALALLDMGEPCGCQELRKPTLLKDE